MQNAAVSRSDKSLVLASVHVNVGLPAVAKQTRRLFGSRGGAARQDALVTANIDVSSAEKTDFEALASHRLAKKQGGDGDARKSDTKPVGGMAIP